MIQNNVVRALEHLSPDPLIDSKPMRREARSPDLTLKEFFIRNICKGWHIKSDQIDLVRRQFYLRFGRCQEG